VAVIFVSMRYVADANAEADSRRRQPTPTADADSRRFSGDRYI
jgi:hypothetical protein